jgi:hypothetical protein
MRAITILFICLFLLFTTIACAYVFQESGSWTETRCGFCGKRIYYYAERSGFDGDSMVVTPRSFCPGESAEYLIYEKKLTVCSICKEKELSRFRRVTEQTDRAVKALQGTYIDVQRRNEELIKEEDMKSVDGKIKELQEKRQQIWEGKK